MIHAGTNDVKDNEENFPEALDKLQDLISLVYEESPAALVLLCTIIPADPADQKDRARRIPKFNEKIPDIVSHFKMRARQIRLVDMNDALTLDDLSDGLHPNKEGYEKMAKTFLEAIEDAEDRISKPGRGSKQPN